MCHTFFDVLQIHQLSELSQQSHEVHFMINSIFQVRKLRHKGHKVNKCQSWYLNPDTAPRVPPLTIVLNYLSVTSTLPKQDQTSQKTHGKNFLFLLLPGLTDCNSLILLGSFTLGNTSSFRYI